MTDLEKLFYRVNERIKFNKYTQIQLEEIDQGSCTLYVDARDDLLNGMEVMHGGMLATLADACMGCACLYLEEGITTADLTYRYVRPVPKGKRVYAKGEVIYEGRRVLRVKGTLSCEGKEVGYASSTYFRLGHPIPREDENDKHNPGENAEG